MLSSLTQDCLSPPLSVSAACALPTRSAAQTTAIASLMGLLLQWRRHKSTSKGTVAARSKFPGLVAQYNKPSMAGNPGRLQFVTEHSILVFYFNFVPLGKGRGHEGMAVHRRAR